MSAFDVLIAARARGTAVLDAAIALCTGGRRAVLGLRDLSLKDRQLLAAEINAALESGDEELRQVAYALAEAVVCSNWTTHSEQSRARERAEALRRRAAMRRENLPESDLDIARARGVPITTVAALLGIPHRRGWARCPFHDDRHPSFHLNDKKQAAFCNVCGRSWDAIALVMEYRDVDFQAAVRELAG